MQTKRKGYSFALLAKQVIFSAGRIKVPKCNWKFKSQAFTFLDKKSLPQISGVLTLYGFYFTFCERHEFVGLKKLTKYFSKPSALL